MLTNRLLVPLTIFLTAPWWLIAAHAPDISGAWLCESNASLRWILDQEPGKIRVKEIVAGKVEADFTCPLSGAACAVKEGRHSETIMMYFITGKLIQIRERGDKTLKQWISTSQDGTTLTVETVPLSSRQKPHRLLFRRQMSLTS